MFWYFLIHDKLQTKLIDTSHICFILVFQIYIIYAKVV